MKKRPEDGVLRLSMEQFVNLRLTLDSRLKPDSGDAIIANWLRQNGFDVSSFAYKHTDIVVDSFR